MSKDADAPDDRSGGKAGNRLRERGPKQSSNLVDRIDGEIELWLSEDYEAYATVPVERRLDGGELHRHFENLEIDSRWFENWLTDRFYVATGDAPGAQAIKEAIAVLSARARREGRIYRTFVRVGEKPGAVWLDLCDRERRAVRIDDHGWRIEPEAGVKFLRTGAMRPLPVPEADDRGAEELLGFLHIGSEDDFKLIVGCLLGALRPRGPYTILAIEGASGAAKTTLCRVCRELIDPRAAPLKGPPASELDLLVTATNSWIVAYDNTSGIQPWLSGAFCRLSTGSGLSMRKLYTTGEEAWFSAARPILLNGIPGPGSRADLLDRAISIEVPEMQEKHRRPEWEFWESFEKARPRIIGALLDGVARAVRDEKRIPPQPTRMADFVGWVEAASPAMGWDRGEYIQIYEANRRRVNHTALESNPVAEALEKLVNGYEYIEVDQVNNERRTMVVAPVLPEKDTKTVYRRTPSALLAELEEIVGRLPSGRGTLRSKTWPSLNRLKGELRRAQVPLRRAGVLLDLDARDGKRVRCYAISRLASDEAED